MCGIAGAVSTHLAPERMRADVRRMADTLVHRGPDGEGFWAGDGVVLGHRRLAIIDLSPTGAQPMTNEDGTLALVCNGEIYNYRALRAELEKRGHRFKGHSDNEVILHLYEEHGPDCVQHLVGMFGFALWDSRQKLLMLARDRVGEKPLYTAQTEAGFFFASEMKALLKAPGVNGAMDPRLISNLMIYPAVPAPDTPFVGIKALPPASRLLFDERGPRVERYWSVSFRSLARDWNDDEALAAFEQTMSTAVLGTCESDVPIAVSLSGGVDSSTVAVHAAKHGATLQSFCVGWEEPGKPDPEFARAARVAEICGLQHNNIQFQATDVSALPYVIQSYDQPLASFPALFAAGLARVMREQAKVVLGGNGADEVFGGYRGYEKTWLKGSLVEMASHVSGPFREALAALVGPRAREALETAALPLPARRGAMMQKAAELLGDRLLSPAAARAVREHRPASALDGYAAECAPRNHLDVVTYTDLMVYHQHGTTVIPDVSGMAVALEIRSPFLDHRVIEFAASLPRRLTVPKPFDPTYNKAIVKRALARHLPDDIVYARKMGFGFNISYTALLQGPWRKVVEAFILKGRFRETGYFNDAGIAWAAAHNAPVAWMLLVLSIWCELDVFHETPGAVADRLAALVS